MPDLYKSAYSYLFILFSSIVCAAPPSFAQSADSAETVSSDTTMVDTVDSPVNRMQPSPALTTMDSGEQGSLTIEDTDRIMDTMKTVQDTINPVKDNDTAFSSGNFYGGYAPLQRSGSRGSTSGGGGPSVSKQPRRRIIEDTTATINDTATAVTASDTIPLPSPDSTETFSLHKMSTRGKIITGISVTAVVGGVITFMLAKKLKNQVIPESPLPDPPPPPDF